MVPGFGYKLVADRVLAITAQRLPAAIARVQRRN